jgi:quinol monooxygenase YgiN
MYLVVARTTARPDRREELVGLLKQLAAGGRQEAGCVSYSFTSDVEDELSFASIEVWENEAALVAHLSTPELAAAVGAMQELIATPPSVIGYQVEGDPKTWM